MMEFQEEFLRESWKFCEKNGRILRETSEDFLATVLEKFLNNFLEKKPGGLPGEVPGEISEETIRGIPEDVSQETAEGIPERNPQGISEQEFPRKIFWSIFLRNSEEITGGFQEKFEEELLKRKPWRNFWKIV